MLQRDARDGLLKKRRQVLHRIEVLQTTSLEVETPVTFAAVFQAGKRGWWFIGLGVLGCFLLGAVLGLPLLIMLAILAGTLSAIIYVGVLFRRLEALQQLSTCAGTSLAESTLRSLQAELRELDQRIRDLGDPA